MTEEGEDYSQARRAFGILISTHGQAMYFVSRFVGGVILHRGHKGDLRAEAPFQVVEPEIQRQALSLLHDQVFRSKPFQVPPEVYGFLVPSLWSHWGTPSTGRKDFPIHDVVSMWQTRILDQLLSPLTLSRLHDAELKLAPDADAMTTAELIEGLIDGIFAEVSALPERKFTNRQPAIDSLRRNLQRSLIKRLGQIVLGQVSAPEDCRTVSHFQLERLQRKISSLLERPVQLDMYSESHLRESASRIKKILDSPMVSAGP
jgi:hypothetical protein